MHIDRDVPQRVRQVDTVPRAVFVQLVMQAFSSPLHFIGSASAADETSKAMPRHPVRTAKVCMLTNIIMKCDYYES